MHAAKVNGKIDAALRHVHMQVVQLTEQVPDPHRRIQPAATAGIDAGRVAVLAIMDERQAPVRAHPVLKIQRPHDTSHIHPIGTDSTAIRLMAEQTAACLFFDPYHLLFQNASPQPVNSVCQCIS